MGIGAILHGVLNSHQGLDLNAISKCGIARFLDLYTSCKTSACKMLHIASLPIFNFANIFFRVHKDVKVRFYQNLAHEGREVSASVVDDGLGVDV